MNVCVQVGPHICVLKTHVDLFDSWNDSTVSMLRDLADKHGRCATAFELYLTAGADVRLT